MAKKSDAAEIERRIEAVYRLILDGWDSTAIVQNSTSRGWGVKSRQIRGYIRRARTRMKDELEKYRLVALEEHVAARRKLRKETSDERVKLEVMRDEAKLLGLYAAEKNESLNIDVSALTARQLERIAQGEDPIHVLATSSGG